VAIGGRNLGDSAPHQARSKDGDILDVALGGRGGRKEPAQSCRGDGTGVATISQAGKAAGGSAQRVHRGEERGV